MPNIEIIEAWGDDSPVPIFVVVTLWHDDRMPTVSRPFTSFDQADRLADTIERRAKKSLDSRFNASTLVS